MKEPDEWAQCSHNRMQCRLYIVTQWTQKWLRSLTKPLCFWRRKKQPTLPKEGRLWYPDRWMQDGLEATAGFEPAMGVLQTPALPLGYVAAFAWAELLVLAQHQPFTIRCNSLHPINCAAFCQFQGGWQWYHG